MQFPIAAAAGFGNVRNSPDLVTSKLAALHFYQLAIPAPKPPKGSFDQAAAARGEVLFNGKADCVHCMYLRFSRSRVGICIRQKKSALMIFKPTARLTVLPNIAAQGTLNASEGRVLP